MDSGCAVATLRPGLSETVAVKLLTLARGRWGAAAGAGLANSGAVVACAVAAVEFMLLRNAFFLAAERAGRSSAATTEIMTITTSNSIRVKARGRIFIAHLVGNISVKHWSIIAAMALAGRTPSWSSLISRNKKSNSRATRRLHAIHSRVASTKTCVHRGELLAQLIHRMVKQ